MLQRIFSRVGWTGRPDFALPAVVAALVAALALIALLWLRPDPAPRAAAQEATPPTSLTLQAPDAPGEPEASSGGASANALAEENVEGIPGADAVEIVGNLKHLRPEEGFPCEGPTTGDDGLIIWRCVIPRGHYAVEVVAEDPLTVLSVTAAAYGAPEGEAEEFFGYVLGLCLEDGAALDPTAFVAGSVPGGGRTFSGGAEISVYGSEGARAMSVVSTGSSFD